ncbi:SIR2 family protein [Alterinioella nitratireducens]|uniref:SIR2 family protein n=1 Tax=Alterinioella nitratireducens TaxID=2735915 RepID=UPI001552FAE0|nr:SIR2 family protein [Alterinioella nitratireducens]NPD20974.1 hypothetical protein [Alterinioella nitratireducens]
MGDTVLTIENEASFKAALKKEINLFVGAGFSILAENKIGQTLPTGQELVDELCAEFSESGLSGQQLPLVSQVIKSKDRIRFNEFLKKRFIVGDYDERYDTISKFSIARIFTTNIDDLLGKVFEKASGKYLNDLILQGATFRDITAVEYLPLHGSVTYPNTDFTFTPIEIASAFSNNPTQFQYLVSCLNKSPTVFLGYSLQDAGALQSLNTTFSSGPQDKARWIQLRQRDAAAESYFRSLGFQIIIGDTDALLDFFANESQNIDPKQAQELTAKDFGSGGIPTLQQTAGHLEKLLCPC